MKLIGKAPINAYIFYTAKAAIVITWLLPILKWTECYSFNNNSQLITTIIAISLVIVGLCIHITSLISLGKSTRIGLPDSNTSLKTNGIYRFSRNPMYIGFTLMQTAIVLYLLHWTATVMTIYVIIVQHFIIISEEKFCEKQFGEAYRVYKAKVRRYL